MKAGFDGGWLVSKSGLSYLIENLFFRMGIGFARIGFLVKVLIVVD